MTEEGGGNGRRKRWLRWAFAGVAGVCALALAAVWFLESPLFQQIVRRRVTEAIERSTGARVEWKAFSIHPGRLEVSLDGFVLHGRKDGAAPPLFSAARIEAQWKLTSVWNLRADLARLRVSGPRIVVAISEDGRSNLPVVSRPTTTKEPWAARLFTLRVRRLEVLRGEFRWNDRRRPFEFHAENFLAILDSEAGAERFAVRLDYQNARLEWGKRAPLVSQAQMKFYLYPARAEIETLEWRTARSRLAVQGAMEDFGSPRVRWSGQAQLDMQEAGEFIGGRGWEGNIRWQGSGQYAASGWLVEGGLEIGTRRGGLPELRGVPWSARSKLRVGSPAPGGNNGGASPWGAQLDELEVTALGGRFAGSATVDTGASGPVVRLEFDARHISLPALLKAASTPSVPLEQLEWAGMISGPVQASFEGLGKNLKVSADWQVEAPPVVPPGYLPASGRLRGSYWAAQKRLETHDSTLHLPQTRLSGDGWLDQQDSRLQGGLDTTHLEEARPVARLFGRQYAEVPLKLFDGGRMEARFLWSGGGAQPQLDGDFALRRFSYQATEWDRFSGTLHVRRSAGIPPAPGAAETAALRSGAGGEGIGGASPLSAGGTAGPGRLTAVAIDSGRLAKGKADAEFQVRFAVQDSSLARNRPFALEGTLHNGDLEELQRLLGVSLPVRGILQASVRASGTLDDPRGEATVSVANGAVYEEPFDRLTARLALAAGDTITASQVRIERGSARVLGDTTVNRKTRAYQFSLTASDLPLGAIRYLQSERAALTGLAQLTLTGRGRGARPQFAGKIELRNLGLNGEGDGSASLDVETRDAGIADGRIALRGKALLYGTDIQVSGEILPADPFPVSARFEFEDADLRRLLRLVRQPPDALAGEVGGVVFVEGEGKNPERLVVRGDLPKLAVTLGAVTARADRPVRFRYQNRQIQIEQLHLAGTKLELDATGSIRPGADLALNLRARGRTDLSALPVLDPQLSVAGQVAGDASLQGTVASPSWNGRLLLSEASLRYGNLPNSLTNIQGTIVFDGNRGLLENVTAESGGGQLRFGGFVAYGDGAPGWRVQLTANAESVRVRYPPGISTVLSGQLTWSGAANDSLLGGRLVIRRETLSAGFDLAQVLVSPRGEAEPPAGGFRSNLRLDLAVTSAPDLRLETVAAKNLQGEVDLRIQGTLERPVWLGRIGIQEGEISFAGRKYTVNRGEITFVNPFRIEPILRLNVQARVQQYDISMDFSGPADHLSLTYHSDPPLPARDILALLVAGSSSPGAAETAPSQPVPEIGAGSLLSQALTAQLGNRLDRIFGAGRIRVDPQLAGLNRPFNASVTFEQQIKDNFTITYVTNVTSVRQQIIQGEWAVSPRFSVVGIRDQNGLVGVNFQMKLRFR